MEERKLNFNTPLLSVRRNRSGSSMNSASLLKGRTDEASRPRNQQKVLASTNVDRCMNQVTEPVSVPFMWEEVPGKAKDDGEPELLPTEETASAIPAIVARISSIIHDDYSGKESRERSQIEKGSVTDEDERYSDAVDALSPANSFLGSCSVSNLSGSDSTVMKLSGTFSVDTQTRDFMMGRFLPAAKAMAIALESSLHCASMKSRMLFTEQPKEVEKPRLPTFESETPSRHQNMEIKQDCAQALCQTESSEEEEEHKEGEDDHSVYGTVTEKSCGLLPQLCLRSSLWLLNPVPGLKSKIKSSMPFVPAIKKDRKVESISQSVFKSGGPQLRSEHQIKTAVSEVGEIKLPGGSTRRNFSCELQKIGRLSPFRSRRSDVADSDKRESPQPAYKVIPVDGMRRLSLSGELRPTRKLSPFRSSRNNVAAIPDKNESLQPPHGAPMLGVSRRENFSGELQIKSRLSPFRPSRNDIMSSEKGEPPRYSYIMPALGRVSRHNFSGELQATSRLSPLKPMRNNVSNLEKNESPQRPNVVPPLRGSSLSRHHFSGELQPSGRLSPLMPLRDEVMVSEEKGLSSKPSYSVPPLGWPGRCNFSGEMKPSGRLSPFMPLRDDVIISEEKELSSKPSDSVPPLGWLGRRNFSGEMQPSSRLSPFMPSRDDVMISEKKDLSSNPSYSVPPLGWPGRRNFSGEMQPSSRLSPFMPSRDDVVISEEKDLSSNPSYPVPPLGWPSQRKFSGEMQTQCRQPPLRPPSNHTTTLPRSEKKDMPTLNKLNGCNLPASPAFERTLYVDTVNVSRDSCLNLDALDREVWIDPVASREAEETSTGESSFQDIECLNVVTRYRTSKEINDGVVDSPSLPLPSLKSPSESWLCHALPSKSDGSPFSLLQKTAPPSTKHNSDKRMVDAKWQMIVKTSKTHHDHTRYSKELVEHIPQKYKS